MIRRTPVAIYGIAALHLSENPPVKPMEVFSPVWRDHWSRICSDWTARVLPTDWVILAGDTSWAMKWAEAAVDLEAVAVLPGKKIILRGNHDYWWTTVTKMRQLADPSFYFLHNNHVAVDDIAICGSRGWITPDDPCFGPSDESIYAHEALRIRTSLQSARDAGFRRLILALHFPPVIRPGATNLFTDLLAEFAVETCAFGHLHDEGIQLAPSGKINGAACRLIACDALDFKLEQLY
jgi:uncharacterized protein